MDFGWYVTHLVFPFLCGFFAYHVVDYLLTVWRRK